jgi:outer membrane protein OmpA-like peptidoglycan-associated protein
MKMFLIAAFVLAASLIQAVELLHLHHEGEVLHSDAVVEESVFINGFYSHDALITESSVSVVREVDSDGTAVLDATFRTEEQIAGLPGAFEWLSSETVQLQRDILGHMIVPEGAARPVLRNIPVFPGRSVAPGDTWTASAEEVHIFRIDGNLAGPYRGDVPVAYEYAGNLQEGSLHLARILISYNLYLPVKGNGEPVRLVSGRSSQELIWNIEAGRPHSKKEEFEFLMMMSDGNVQEFRGRQEVSYRTVMKLDRVGETDLIRRDLEEIPGVDVSLSEQGVHLTILDGGQILFGPESALVSSDQLYRLEALTALLERYSDRDILITGHTAHFGTAEGRSVLSGDRAAAVAAVLFPEGRSGGGRLYLRGAGSDEPVAEEEGEAAWALNRRVEILILD